MGFFKKIFKGIKKVFKKIGKAVKSAFKKVGKFMGKIGIVGQLGLALIMPYALPALGGLATGMMGTQLGGVLGAAVKGAGHFLNAAVKLGTRVGTAFKSVTKAVTDTIGNMVGATLNQIPGAGDFIKGISGGKIDITNKTFSSAWEATQNAWSNAGDSLGNLFSKSTFDSSMNKFGIQANLQESVAGDFDTSNISYDPVTGETSIGVDRATGTLGNQGVGLDVADSLGLGTEGTTYKLGATPTNYVELAQMGTPLNIPEASFTVGGTEPTSSLLSPSRMGGGTAYEISDITKATRPIAADPFTPTDIDVRSVVPDASKVRTEFDAFTNITDPASVGSKSLAAQAGARSKEFLKGQGVELTTAGAITMAQDYLDAESAEAQMQRLTDPFANIEMSYLTPGPVITSPRLSTTGLTPMSGWDYFNQIQDDILNSNFSNIYSQGYYGSPSLQAGLAMAYQELNQ